MPIDRSYQTPRRTSQLGEKFPFKVAVLTSRTALAAGTSAHSPRRRPTKSPLSLYLNCLVVLLSTVGSRSFPVHRLSALRQIWNDIDHLIPINLWCHPTISLPSAGGPSQSSPPIFRIVFLRTLPQHRRSRFSGSVSRLTSFGVPTLT